MPAAGALLWRTSYPGGVKVDLTVLAIPGFVGAMAAEYAWHRRNPGEETSAGTYELADTMASLTMGIGSLVAPLITDGLGEAVGTRRGRALRALMCVSLAGAAVATAGDVIRRSRTSGLLEAGTVPSTRETGTAQSLAGELVTTSSSSHNSTTTAAPQRTATSTPQGTAAPTAPTDPLAPTVPPEPEALARITGGAAVTALASTVVTVSTLWSAKTASSALFRRTPLDLGAGALAYAVGVVGWDFLYYWNHRLSHESRWLWAVHVVHHSSERYNLATALRQPVAEALTIYVPYGALSLLGVWPAIVQNARAINLLYQFWVHTEAIRSIGRAETVFNSPSHHRVHHGSNRRYLDRNHGGILILWDRLFGTFEPERERVVYGLTTNIETHNPVRIATHEWVAIARDVFRSRTWRDRVSYLVRGPGWAGAARD